MGLVYLRCEILLLIMGRNLRIYSRFESFMVNNIWQGLELKRLTMFRR